MCSLKSVYFLATVLLILATCSSAHELAADNNVTQLVDQILIDALCDRPWLELVRLTTPHLKSPVFVKAMRCSGDCMASGSACMAIDSRLVAVKVQTTLSELPITEQVEVHTACACSAPQSQQQQHDPSNNSLGSTNAMDGHESVSSTDTDKYQI